MLDFDRLLLSAFRPKTHVDIHTCEYTLSHWGGGGGGQVLSLHSLVVSYTLKLEGGGGQVLSLHSLVVSYTLNLEGGGGGEGVR